MTFIQLTSGVTHSVRGTTPEAVARELNAGSGALVGIRTTTGVVFVNPVRVIQVYGSGGD